MVGENQSEDEEGKRDGGAANADQLEPKRRKLKFSEHQGEKTLERIENINLSSFDTQHLVDPLFKKTTRMFDEMSLSTLMSSQLQSTPNLLLQIDSSISSALSSKIQTEPEEEKSRYVDRLCGMMPDLAKEVSSARYISQPVEQLWQYIKEVCQENQNQLNYPLDRRVGTASAM